MSRVEKISEPSMEDILASIRKIISEEPAGAKSATPSLPAAPVQSAITQSATGISAPSRMDGRPVGDTKFGDAKSDMKTQAPSFAEKSPFPDPKKPSSEALDMDEVLGLADDMTTKRSKEPQRAAAPSTPAAPLPSTAAAPPVVSPGLPSWLFPKPASEKPAPAAVTPAASPSASASASAPQGTPKPFFPPASRDAAPSGSQSAAVPSASDFGAIVPGRGPTPSPHASEARHPELKIDQPRPQPGAPEFHRGASAIDALRVPEPGAGFPGLSRGPEIRGQEIAPASPHINGFNGRPGAGQPANSPSAATPLPSVAPTLSSPAAETAPKFAKPFEPAMASEPAKPAFPLASDRKPEPSPAQAVTPIPTPAAAIPVPAFTPAPFTPAIPSTPATPSTPSAAARPVPATVPAPVSAAVVAPSLAAQASVPVAPEPEADPAKSMEDTVAELLRPMLRQWLDNNMPRIVERALRVELAASAKPKSDQQKH